jgi:hypothetical protein
MIVLQPTVGEQRRELNRSAEAHQGSGPDRSIRERWVEWLACKGPGLLGHLALAQLHRDHAENNQQRAEQLQGRRELG